MRRKMTLKECHKKIEALQATILKQEEEVNAARKANDSFKDVHNKIRDKDRRIRRLNTAIDVLADRALELGITLGTDKIEELDRRKGFWNDRRRN